MRWAGSVLRRLPLLLLSLPLSLPLVAAPADENCIYLKETEMLHKVNSHCYCYVQNRRMDFKYIWSAIQVKINSTEMFEFVPISEESNCQNSENVFAFAKCVVQSFWQSETFKETNINIIQYGEKMCFRIQPLKNTSYAVSVERNMVDKKLFLLFVAGVFLFYFANTLSRSAVFYYSAGVVLGILATLVFLLLTLKRFIPKHSTFWILMSGCWMSSLYFIYYLQEGMKWLWSEYRIYLLGYFFTVGFISFAVCYKRGPLTNERSITLLTWTLQMIAFLLIYFSVTIPEVAYAIIVVILCSKGLHYPVGVICYVGRKIKNLLKSKKSVFRYLTEEEYGDQGETETTKALEELRVLCRDPDFPSWLAVSKLHSPHKFANFVLGSPHVSPAELKTHDEQYGLGGSFLEQQLFNTRTESEQDHSATPTEEEEDEIQEQNRSENVAFSYNDELF
ncbi:PREDICTED: nuclear envelope integral membrane protein 2 isoform X1 [Crocodylus porosus]|uniref:Nuclear envelope integral membrane protein 2 n=2 Tax=Crocodylus porosus TaxID=8502 RepID=A0A7M4FYE7_CROPO|nr:PREDICTED: nuclear envelope integral membrane protein 2 isoform X1 [Crocodylus porosus]